MGIFSLAQKALAVGAKATDAVMKPLAAVTTSPVERELVRPFVNVVKGVQGLAGNQTAANKPVNTPFGEVKPYGNPLQNIKSQPNALKPGEAAWGAVDLATSVPGAAEKLGSLGAEGVTKALGPLAEPLGKGVEKVAGALKGSAIKTFEEGLAPTTQKFKALASKVAPQAVDQGIVGTLGGIAKKAQRGVEEAGQAIEDFGKLKGKISIQPILDTFEKAKESFTVAGKAVEPEKLAVVNHFQDIVKSLGDAGGEVGKEDLRALKRIWDESVYSGTKAIGKTLEEGTKIDIQKMGTDAVRNLLASSEPDLAKINAKFNFYKNLSDIAEATKLRRVGQTGVIRKGIGAAVGTAVGGAVSKVPIIGELIGAKAGEYIASIGGSTLYKSLNAAAKSKVAEALISGIHDPAAVASFFAKTTLPEIKTKDLIDFLNSKAKLGADQVAQQADAQAKRAQALHDQLFGGAQASPDTQKRQADLKNILFK